MNRCLVLLSLLLTLSWPVFAQARRGIGPSELSSAILDCRIDAGPWQDAFKDNPQAAGFRYYFVSHGLRAVVAEGRAGPPIQAYLGHVLSKANKVTGLWDDVPDFNLPGTELADADDSNAALLLLLAADFYQTPAGKIWWQANAARLKLIANQVLLRNGLPSGLVTGFSQMRVFPPNTPNLENCLALQHSAYLMDCCEVYGGLHALAGVLKEMRDPDEASFTLAAAGVAKGIAALYQPKAGAFYILDTEQVAYPNYYPADMLKFYPHRLAQVFPELFDVPLGNAATTKQRYDAAWAFATATGDFNVGLPKDGSADGYPNMVRACMLAKRKLTTPANAQLQWYFAELKQGEPSPKFLMINEMGFALKTRAILAGKTVRP